MSNKSQPDTKPIKYFSQSQSSRLIDFLTTLSKSQCTGTKEDFLLLEDIYSNGSFTEKYHHYYKDIYSAVTQVEDLDALGHNLEVIKETYSAQKIDIKTEIEKLFDHLNLEASRHTYSTAIQEQTKSLISNLDAKLKKSEKSYGELTKKNSTIEKQLDNARVDYITILGIFASIVLGFVGSIVFSTSVLENINTVSIYRLVFMAGIIGFVFFNIIFILLQFVAKISNKEVKLHSFWFFNSIIIILLILTPIIYWHNNKSPEPVPQVINIFEQVQDK